MNIFGPKSQTTKQLIKKKSFTSLAHFVRTFCAMTSY